MESKTLLVFNPEHDLALAVGSGPYTPPESVRKIRKNNALLPAIYAGNGDFILVPDEIEPPALESLPYFSLAESKNIRIIKSYQIPEINHLVTEVKPWGWDHAIRNSFLDYGVNPALLPSEKFIEKVRELSHRRLTIAFREKVAAKLNMKVQNPPKELFSIEDLENFLSIHHPAYFKAPWSSSGRGIVVSDHISRKGLLEWAHGVLKHQGSILAEPSWIRAIDFATEWNIENNKPVFVGYSVFKTSSRGKYHGNVTASQKELIEMIKSHAPSFDEKIIEAQADALESLIAPGYEGPLGIDMLADTNGCINSCVEINLRLTMGHVAAIQQFSNSVSSNKL